MGKLNTSILRCGCVEGDADTEKRIPEWPDLWHDPPHGQLVDTTDLLNDDVIDGNEKRDTPNPHTDKHSKIKRGRLQF